MEMPVKDFLERSNVENILAELKTKFSKKPLSVSDVSDEKYQYVDLVQEGGGVWGIALAGFTYILEEMGIRFFNLAGTGAGSVNAMLLACAGNKEDAKSEKILEELLRLDLARIVDGKRNNRQFTRWAKKFIQKLITKKNFVHNLIEVISWSLGITIFLCIASFVANFIAESYVVKWIGLGAGVCLLTLIACIAVACSRFKNFTENGYGLNEGTFFHNWIKNSISKYYVGDTPAGGVIKNLADFQKHFSRIPPGLKVKADRYREDNRPPDNPMMAIITCAITSERKIEFPRMWDLYWKEMRDIHPGDFVRASMSIPVFFDAYTLHNINRKSRPDTWRHHLNWKGKFIPQSEQFVDGGTLSNFPIGLFANAANGVPRMPTFGIRLLDSSSYQLKNTKSTMAGYFSSMIGTMRANYDRDLINKNRAFDLGVKEVPMDNHNWLNFFMTTKEKIDIFNCGAEAAKTFLLDFHWERYKAERLQNWRDQRHSLANPNNYH